MALCVSLPVGIREVHLILFGWRGKTAGWQTELGQDPCLERYKELSVLLTDPGLRTSRWGTVKSTFCKPSLGLFRSVLQPASHLKSWIGIMTLLTAENSQDSETTQSKWGWLISWRWQMYWYSTEMKNYFTEWFESHNNTSSNVFFFCLLW